MTKEPHLDEDEEKEADEYEKVPSSVIFEAIRREGEHELSRGFSAGISNLGYTVGFLIVILGRMQLFTENTITPDPAAVPRADPDAFLSDSTALGHRLHREPCRMCRRGAGDGLWPHRA